MARTLNQHKMLSEYYYIFMAYPKGFTRAACAAKTHGHILLKSDS